ncbi:MAG: ATP-grasp domain-containing protein [Planctomycetales bacterium]|nr:ATP-grasp domain-containing protein [Planctomycetales bacterium]
MNVLVSSAGRRGALIRLIRETVQPRGGCVYAVDAAPWSSACRLADEWRVVPPFSDANFFDSIVSFCKQRDIRLIVPTHDCELPVYAKLRPLFHELGIHVACSGSATIQIARNKHETAKFLRQAGLPSPAEIDLDRALRGDTTLPYPLVVKPSDGSGSRGVQIVTDAEELTFYLRRTTNPIVQQCAEGREYTTNLFVNRSHRCLVAVPHWRVETRGGEVSKCMTVRHPSLIDLASRLADALPDPYGALCFQAFVSSDGQAQVIEINARFGGGYPIAHQAGANFVQMLIDDVEGREVSQPDWSDGLAMTRWDDAVFWHPQQETAAPELTAGESNLRRVA